MTNSESSFIKIFRTKVDVFFPYSLCSFLIFLYPTKGRSAGRAPSVMGFSSHAFCLVCRISCLFAFPYAYLPLSSCKFSHWSGRWVFPCLLRSITSNYCPLYYPMASFMLYHFFYLLLRFLKFRWKNLENDVFPLDFLQES